jgi:hypothetical protein
MGAGKGAQVTELFKIQKQETEEKLQEDATDNRTVPEKYELSMQLEHDKVVP